MKRIGQPTQEGARGHHSSSWGYACSAQASCLLNAGLSSVGSLSLSLQDSRPPTQRFKVHCCYFGNYLWTCKLLQKQRRCVRHGECAIQRPATYLSVEIEVVGTHTSTSSLHLLARLLCLANNGGCYWTMCSGSVEKS